VHSKSEFLKAKTRNTPIAFSHNYWGFFYLINIDGLVKSDAPRAPSLHKASHFIGQARQGFLGTSRQKYSDARHTNTK
jgi:hypothetical protein